MQFTANECQLGRRGLAIQEGRSIIEGKQARLYMVKIVEKALNIMQSRITSFYTWIR